MVVVKGGETSGAHASLNSGDGKVVAASGDSRGSVSSGAAGQVFHPATARAATESTPVEEGGASLAVSAVPATADEQKLTGQRHDTSVLFSLSDLQVLATDAGRAAAPSSAARSTSGGTPDRHGRPNHANARNDGSGRIDIRAMAAATLQPVRASSASSDWSEFPGLSAAPLCSPVVTAPLTMRSPERMPKWAWAVIALGGLTFLNFAALVVALVLRTPEPPLAAPVLTVANNPAPSTGRTAPTAGGTPTSGASTAAPEGEVAGIGAKAGGTERRERSTSAAKGGRHIKTPPPSKKDGGAKPAAIAVADTGPSRISEERPAPKDNRNLNDDVADLLSSGGGNSAAPRRVANMPRSEAPSPSSIENANLPDHLDRGEILAGMKAVTPKVMACYQQYRVPGNAIVNVVIAKTGRVQSAAVDGALSGTPTGDCVSRAVKSASFRRFARATMTIQYLFLLR